MGPATDRDEDDDCTGDDHDVGEGRGGAAVDKIVEATGKVAVEEAKKKDREETNRAESSRVRKPKWRAYNALNRTVREEPSDQAVDEFVKETKYHSKELQSLKGNDDESDKRLALFHKNAEYGQVQLQLDMLFPNLQVFKGAVKDYTISIGREVVMKKNDKGYYGGTLVAVVPQDLNHSFYVIAYGVMKQETKDSWSWFLRRLLEDIRDPREHGWEIISDMQKEKASSMVEQPMMILNKQTTYLSLPYLIKCQ
ncbi:hypothetical protein CRG98_005920 [Punica granatum]|uniref:MULE transposase domain-containing protein n=1 Tax=Punica granatum TaxID=22663 RepID=A0A2I0KYY3_PUNGR|nr:hypothetical protein CRG98_005920 [Punica granatum]